MARIKHTLLLCILLVIAAAFIASKTAQAQNIITGQRIQGSDRYATNIAISRLGWPETSEIAVITTGEDFPDALSASSLAGKYNAPILLANSKTLAQPVRDELRRLGAGKVYIVGGKGAVSENIQNQLAAMGIQCVRLGGADRYETSAAVAREVGNNGTVVVATGENYPDALSIAPWAAARGIPILLMEGSSIPSSMDEYIKDNYISKVYVIGGEGAVGGSVVSKLPGNIKRLWGEDRFKTNLAVINEFGSDFDLGKLYLATGNDFPDALSGSALASISGSPIILTDRGLISDTRNAMHSNAEKLNEVYFLGGEGVVSAAAISGVLPPVATGLDIKLQSTVIGLNREMKVSVDVTTIPGNASKPQVTPVVSDSDIASIGSNGSITGISPGNTTITATLGILNANKTITVRQSMLIVLDPGHGGWSSGAVPSTPGGTKLPEHREAVLNMQITQKIRTRLENLGYSVVLTREGDTYKTLEDRANIANDLNADMFISIHHDALTTSSSGTSAFYSDYKPGIDTSGVYVQAGSSGAVYDENNNRLGYLTKGSTYTYVGEDNGDIYIMFNGKAGRTTINDVMVYDNTPSTASLQSRVLALMINEGIASLGLAKRGTMDKNFAVTRLTNGVSVLVEVGFISNPYEFLKISQDSFQNSVADKIVQAVQDFYSIY